MRDIIKDFKEDQKTNGVWTMDGMLNIRPPYQREFVYTYDEQREVIGTILDGCPLGNMYFHVQRDSMYPDDEELFKYAVADGQQRIISICNFYNHVFPIYQNAEAVTFEKLGTFDREVFLDYELTIWICDGTLRDLLKLFKRINIAGKVMNDQELRSSTACLGKYGWILYAKDYFCRKGMGADDKNLKYNKFLTGDVIRQDYLETAIKWHALSLGYDAKYKGKDMLDMYVDNFANARDKAQTLIKYFEDVMNWVKDTFIGEDFKSNYHPCMKSLNWGVLYNNYVLNGDVKITPEVAQRLVKSLYEDDSIDLSKQKAKTGIYEYALTCDANGENGDLTKLCFRAFDEEVKRLKWIEQNMTCPYCNREFNLEDMEGHHKKAWSEGGKTDYDNCEMVCEECHTMLSARQNAKRSKKRDEASEEDV